MINDLLDVRIELIKDSCIAVKGIFKAVLNFTQPLFYLICLTCLIPGNVYLDVTDAALDSRDPFTHHLTMLDEARTSRLHLTATVGHSRWSQAPMQPVHRQPLRE